MKGFEFLIAAYALVWAFVFVYLVWLGRRQEKLRREVDALRKALTGYGGKQGKGDGSA